MIYEQKNPKIQDITNQLEQGVKELFESERYKTWLKTMSKFHSYSLNNTLLIYMQKPEATHVAGYQAWQKQFGRQVRKGEESIRILAPVPYKVTQEIEKIDPQTGKVIKDPQGNPIYEKKEVLKTGFKAVSVFDVSQTEGRELPTLGVSMLKNDVKNYDVLLQALLKSTPVPVDFKEIDGAGFGYYSSSENRIAIKPGLPQAQTVKTLIHEMAHQKMHGTDQKESEQLGRSQKEIEAEAVAYTLCQHYGIDSSDYSFAYIAGWSKGKDTTELRASLDRIRHESSSIITDVDKNINEITKQKEQNRLYEAKKSLEDAQSIIRAQKERSKAPQKPDIQQNNSIINIPESLLLDLMKYHICGLDDPEISERIRAGLNEQLTSFRTGPNKENAGRNHPERAVKNL